MKQQNAQERAGEAGADVELPLAQDQRDLVGDHVAHQAAEGAGRHAHDQDDRPGGAGVARDRHAGGGCDRERQRVEPDDRLVAGLEAVGGEERQDRRGAGDREVVRAADPEHRVPPEHQIAERAAPDAGEAGEKQEPHDVELGARRDEAAGQREDEDRDQVEDGSRGHRSPLGWWHAAPHLNRDGAVPRGSWDRDKLHDLLDGLAERRRGHDRTASR